MGVSRVLFQAPLSGGLKVAEGAREVLDAVVNGSAIFVCFVVVDVTFSSWDWGETVLNSPSYTFWDIRLWFVKCHGTIPQAVRQLPCFPRKQGELSLSGNG